MSAHRVDEKYLPDDADYSIHEHACPRCSGDVYRVPRRAVDMIVSHFIVVHRYRCTSRGCGWEGNMRMKRYSLLIR